MPDVYPTPRPLSGARARQFAVANGYDATDDRGRRRAPLTRTMHEDHHADERRRRIISATSRDLARNYSIAAWAIRKHLDFCSTFNLKLQTTDPGFNEAVESWWYEASRKHNFDVANRHPHSRMVRLSEACRIVDGDLYWLKLAPPAGNPLRGKVQAIESDRVDMPRGDLPKNSNPEDWVNGVRIDPRSGRALSYGICRRVGKTRKQLERIVPAKSLIAHAAYEFRIDQVRGVSPFVSCLNAFRDCYEAIDFQLAKVKLGALFGLQVTRAAGDGMSFAGPATNQEDTDGDGTADSAPRIDLKRGPFVTELEPGEEVKVIEAKTPSTETVAFLQVVIEAALKALDLDMSMYDSSRSTFYGSRGAVIQYLRSCESKIGGLQEFQDEHFAWRLGLAIEDGELQLPSGKDFGFVDWEFVHTGLPWFDAAKEARGEAMGIAMGATSPQRVCRERGTDLRTNLWEIAEAQQMAQELGVSLKFADSSAFAPEITVSGGEVANAN